MTKRISLTTAAGLALLFAAAPAQAQVGWESPLLASPDTRAGIGAYLVEVAAGDLGGMVTWRGMDGSFRLRGGLADAPGDMAVFAGADLQGGLVQHTQEFPLDVHWVAGAGGSFGNEGLLTATGGVTVGRTVEAETLSLTPYVTPRLVFDAFLADVPGDDTNLDFVADVGLDLNLENLLLRFGFSLGDRGDESLAIGIVF